MYFYRRIFRAVFFSIAGNMGLTLIKGLSGILGNSHALIADAIESMTDVFSSLFIYMEYAIPSVRPMPNILTAMGVWSL